MDDVVRSANTMQFGGKHYKTAYEHWDLVLNLSLGYFEGQATRYITRWRNKNGMEDLQKALHYINKMLENVPGLLMMRSGAQGGSTYAQLAVKEIARFAEANALGEVENTLLLNIVLWRDAESLHACRDLLLMLMDQADPGPDPVPLTEENHHAERAGE